MDQSILHFLHALKSTLRKHRHACASISLAPYISTESWGGVGWTQKLGWVSDATLTLAAFSGRSKDNLTEAILSEIQATWDFRTCSHRIMGWLIYTRFLLLTR